MASIKICLSRLLLQSRFSLGFGLALSLDTFSGLLLFGLQTSMSVSVLDRKL